MPNRKVITDKFVNKFVEGRRKTKAPKGARLDFWDALLPSMSLRVTDTGAASFCLTARFPSNPDHPTRRCLGTVDQITLGEARDKGRKWVALIQRGVDPRVEEEREKAQAEAARRAEDARRQVTLTVVAEAFIADKLGSERKGAEVERSLRRDLLPHLGDTPIAEITKGQIRELVKAKKRSAPGQARNLLGDIKRLFAWAEEEALYGLASSPAADIRAKSLLGAKKTGERTLDDVEVFALWRAAGKLPFPYGAVYRLLALTGLRLNEVAEASWPEFDFAKREWTIPARRMKGKNGMAREHVVPLTQEILTVLASVPESVAGDYVFSLTGGESPIWMGTKAKKRLDKFMLRTLRALAWRRGDDPAKVALPSFVNHDIRRTLRSALPGLKNEHKVPISTEVAEAVLAHAQPGIKGTYNRYQYLPEKQEALELWAAELARLAQPRVVSLASKRGRKR